MNRLILGLLMSVLLVCGGGALGIVTYKSFSNPPRTEHQLTAEKIEHMGELVLVKFNIRDVLEQTKEMPFYLPNARALLIVVGDVTAGIDLKQVRKEDLIESDSQVIVKLPRPKILGKRIDHERSKIYDLRTMGWKTAELIDEAWRAAENAILSAARDIGYEKTCETNARVLLGPLFAQMSGKQVVIEFKR